jgi:hypothetical protein
MEGQQPAVPVGAEGRDHLRLPLLGQVEYSGPRFRWFPWIRGRVPPPRGAQENCAGLIS